MPKNLISIILFLNCFMLSAQKQDSLSIKNGIDNPSLLATHHFGIFSSRINSNFKLTAPKHAAISFNSISGNNFHPYVEAYFPEDPAIRQAFSNTKWHDRHFNFIDQETTPADYMNIVIDAVIKEFRLGLSLPLSPKHELAINLRSYLITKGKYPFSLLTSDETLEWFHSNLAGGEDPYGRRYYGLNQVNFKYNDRNGNTLELNNNDFFLGGIEINHFYYPTLSINQTKQIYLNFGTHMGINTSKYNASLDLGVSANAVKKINIKTNYELNFGFGVNALRKNVIDSKNNIDLGNNPFLATLEGEFELTKYTRKKNYHSLGVNYQAQTRYNKKTEADYFTLRGKWQEINGGWQNGVYNLYEPQVAWNLIYTYGRPKLTFTIYFKEDFLINNAPDFQTGIGLKFPILK